MVLVWFSTLIRRSCSFGPLKMVRFYPAHYPPLCVAGLNLCILDVWKLGQLDPKIRSHWGSERFGKSPMMLTWSRLWWNPVTTCSYYSQVTHVKYTIHPAKRPEEKPQAFLASVTEPIPRPPLDAPVPPELQLLAVLPAQSAPLLPPAMRPLVEEKKGVFFQVKLPLSISGLLSWFLPKKISGIWPQDSSSSIADFYPREFQLDLKPGDKDWQVPCGWWFFMVFLPIVVLDTASKGQILLCDIS